MILGVEQSYFATFTAFLLMSILTYPSPSRAEGGWSQLTPSAAFGPRDSSGEVVYDDHVWLLGGYNPIRVNEVWKSADGITWIQVTASAPWSARNLPGAVVFKDKMWIMGGSDGRNFANDVWNSRDGAQWTQITDKAEWSGRCATTPVVFQDKLWIVGGMGALDGTTHFNDVWCSDDGERWTQVTASAPWSPRGMHGTLVYDGKLWVIAGGVYDEKKASNIGAEFADVWCTTDGHNWQCVTPKAVFGPRRFFGALVFDQRMWLIAGAQGEKDGATPSPWWLANRNDVWYSTDGVEWTEVKGAPWSIRHESAVVAFKNRLLLIGGFGSVLFNDVWSYEPASDRPGGSTEPAGARDPK